MALIRLARFALLLIASFSFTLAAAQAQMKVASFLFHKVIEGQPLPISRIGPDPNLSTKGFALYREGNGGYEQYRKMVCDIGVSEIYVLSGNGAVETEYNRQLAREESSKPCPNGDKKAGLAVKFGLESSESQLVKNPLTTDFLKKYDDWVENAKVKGKKIAFRCNCGCHRTGRLAGYSEMKFFGRTPEQALKQMKNVFDSEQEGVKGKFFARKWKRGTLKQQIVALNDYIHHQPCTTSPEYCVVASEVNQNFALRSPSGIEPDDDLSTAEKRAESNLKAWVDDLESNQCLK